MADLGDGPSLELPKLFGRKEDRRRRGRAARTRACATARSARDPAARGSGRGDDAAASASADN